MIQITICVIRNMFLEVSLSFLTTETSLPLVSCHVITRMLTLYLAIIYVEKC